MVIVPLRVNLAEEMQPSGRQRQLCRNLGDLSAQQFLASQLRGGLLNRQATQGWGA